MARFTIPHHKKTIGERELVVMAALLMSLSALGIDSMLPALDDIAADMGGVEGNRRQLVVAVFMLANGAGSLLPGALADRFGRRRILLVALAGYASLSALMMFISDFDWLLVARAAQGLTCSAFVVVPAAIIRDRYEGDRMARLMSMVSAVFITIPIIAPSLGQAVMLVAGWRWIFALLGAVAAGAALWVWARLPETLDPQHRQRLDPVAIIGNMGRVLLDRGAVGYIFASALTMGGVFGYIISAQQLLGDHFETGEWFPLIFGATAAMMMVSNIVNSRIVQRFGARRVSHTGVFAFILVSVAQVWAAYRHPDELALFLPLIACNLGLLGFLGANFSSIAMQPFARIAGAASGVQTFFRTFGAALIGLGIGQAFDGSARPFALSLLTTSVLSLLLVSFSERGRLFRRLHPPPAQRAG